MKKTYLLASASALLLSVAPVAAQDAALVELNLNYMNLATASGNDGDFDNAAVGVLNGQGFFRTGDFVIELQGTTTTSVDDTDNAENSTSFGVVGHYMLPYRNGTAGLAFGLQGGTNVEESDGAIYSLAALNYAENNWMVGLGATGVVYGQRGDDQVTALGYLQGAYDFDVAPDMSVRVGGYLGLGQTSDDTVHAGELSATLYRDFSDTMAGHVGVSAFALQTDSKQANGWSINAGISIAIGGSNSGVRDSIPFDTPNLHREMTWADEAL
ncbi:hypothetical protein [Aliiroseovarius subalbicans]|uniref:hypothetical protein n=1 Tax=Aliiroseovarius subalbicans TaxID=2925840 RepID=UPI001F5A8AC2|nr:hypothetical protein [Aliiroseovarius subalbicans]MCI2399994.1 hypothetical protein [Aliiroseovarius subalbicans]